MCHSQKVFNYRIPVDFFQFNTLHTLTSAIVINNIVQEDIFYNVIMIRLGDKIKELRLERELSQTQLAKIIGVSQKAIDYWERNVNEPKANYIIALVKFFEISYDEFFADI